MPYRLALFDDGDGRPVHVGTFATPEEAGQAAMTSQKERMERGDELWPSVTYIDATGRAHGLDPAERRAFRAGLDTGMNELIS